MFAMSNNFTSNKRIAKNTIVIYAQLFVTIVVNLLMSRYVLQVIGVSDYGLYNVVGGVVSLFTFISSSLQRTTIRFLNFEMGKQNGDTNRVFNQCNLIHIVFSLVVLFLLESFGVFYIQNYLNVEVSKGADAMFVFQVSTIAMCIGIANVPYQSIFIAHERFSFVAVIEIVRTSVKFLLVLLLFSYSGNVLRLYALLMSGVTLGSLMFYQICAMRHWPDIVKWKFVNDLKLYKEQVLFSNWTLLKTLSMVARHQGSVLLINMFFGTTVNAAYAIAYTVQNQVMRFVSKFDGAVAPQITQNISAGKIERSIYLASHSCRYCLLLMEIVFFTLYVDLDLILTLWLGTYVPDGTLIFCRYTLLMALVSTTSGGLVQLINGVGKLKRFVIQMFFLYMMSIVFGYIFFKAGFPAHIIVILFVLSDLFYRISELYLLKKVIPFNILKFCCDSYLRPGIIFAIMCVIVALLDTQFISVNNPLVKITGVFLATLFLCIFVGLEKEEINFLKRKLLKSR